MAQSIEQALQELRADIKTAGYTLEQYLTNPVDVRGLWEFVVVCPPDAKVQRLADAPGLLPTCQLHRVGRLVIELVYWYCTSLEQAHYVAGNLVHYQRPFSSQGTIIGYAPTPPLALFHWQPPAGWQELWSLFPLPRVPEPVALITPPAPRVRRLELDFDDDL